MFNSSIREILMIFNYSKMSFLLGLKKVLEF